MRVLLLVLLILTLSSCDDDSPRYNGYIDADLIYLSSSFPGRLSELLVRGGQNVDKEQLLFKVEQISDDYSVAMSELSQKNIIEQKKELIHQIKYNELNYQRIIKMHSQDAASQNDLELARKDLAILKDKLAAIDTQIKSSELNTKNKLWERARKEGITHQKGIIFDTYFTEQEYVQSGQPILSLLVPEQIKAVFFIPEPKLRSTKLNGKVKLFSGDNLIGEGVIRYISKVAQYTPPIIYSREESSNLVFRVEAHLKHPDLNQIHLGQPISLELVS